MEVDKAHEEDSTRCDTAYPNYKVVGVEQQKKNFHRRCRFSDLCLG